MACPKAQEHANFGRGQGAILRSNNSEPPMSQLGQKQTSHSETQMSALPPKADIGERSYDVRFVP
jgi:hypothetical protein